MLEIVQLPLARRLWGICKFFRLPLNDERIQSLSEFDIEFYELSQIADDPKKLQQLKEHYYDPEFDEWLEEFDQEQSDKTGKSTSEQVNNHEDFEESLTNNETDDWEEVD